MKNDSTQKGSIALALLALMVLIGLGVGMYFYISNEIKSEASFEEIQKKEKEALSNNNVKKAGDPFARESKSSETIDIKLYFPKKSFSNCPRDLLKEDFEPVNRTIKSTQAIAYASLNELFKGLTEEEKSQGYWSDIPEGTYLRSLYMTDGTAYIDLNEKVEEGFTLCSGGARLMQIKMTLAQFPMIGGVRYSINGKPETLFSKVTNLSF